jgi:hypothetical protein
MRPWVPELLYNCKDYEIKCRQTSGLASGVVGHLLPLGSK